MYALINSHLGSQAGLRRSEMFMVLIVDLGITIGITLTLLSKDFNIFGHRW